MRAEINSACAACALAERARERVRVREIHFFVMHCLFGKHCERRDPIDLYS